MAESVKFGTNMVIMTLKHNKKGGSVFGEIFGFYHSICLIVIIITDSNREVQNKGSDTMGKIGQNCCLLFSSSF